jgi:hypothetical protein
VKRSLQVALKVARINNPYATILDVLTAVLTVPLVGDPGYAIPAGSSWQPCVAYSNCGTEPVYMKFGQNRTGACAYGTGTACLDLQAFAELYALGTAPASNINQIIFCSEKNAAGTRVSHVQSFARPTTSATGLEPQWKLGHATTLRTLNPNLQRLLATNTALESQAQVEPVARTLTVTRTATAVSPPASVPPHRSKVAVPWTKEKKVMSRGKAAAIAIARALDWLSESAEVVSALYDALPDDVKNRWRCDSLDRPGDQMGQYGVDGADCKLQALYWNWHRLDVRAALGNILTNEIEDRLYGTAFGARQNISYGAFR